MTTGVLVMAYGTPANRDDIAAFYSDVRRGRPPNAEQLAELVRRYDAIGGTSPLVERTTAQIRAIQRVLDERAPARFTTYFGAKHAEPKIETAIDAIADDGHDGVVGLVLAPHYSSLSIGEYIERMRTAATTRHLVATCVERWGDDPVLVDALAERVTEATSALSDRSGAEVVFTAHSLPARVLDMHDPYPDELADTAVAVAERVGLARWRIAWQSAGRTPEPWLGPSLLETIDELADTAATAVVVCPAGFTSDHLEVLYDVDIEAAARARSRGLAFARTRSLNDDPAIAAMLAERVIEAADALLSP